MLSRRFQSGIVQLAAFVIFVYVAWKGAGELCGLLVLAGVLILVGLAIEGGDINALAVIGRGLSRLGGALEGAEDEEAT